MDEHTTRDVDGALSKVVSLRSTRATPAGLLADVRAAVAPVQQRRGRLGWRPIGLPVLRVAGVAALFMLLALAIGFGAGSRSNLLTVASPSPAPAAARLFDCTSRTVPSAAKPLDLTGTWSDRANLYYLRQTGDTLWGVAINSPEATYPDLVAVGPYLVLHGTIAGDGTVHVDWSTAGDRFPGDQRFGYYSDKGGTLTWKISSGAGGSVQLVTTVETGNDLTGPLYGLPILDPCVPVVQ